MDIKVTGKNIDLGEALQSHVGTRLEDSIAKYFGRRADALVTFARERHLVGCEVTAHLDSGVFLAAHGDGADAYGAFQDALDKLEKRVRRHKRRLRDHHANGRAALPAEGAAHYTLAPLPEEDENAEAAGAEPAPIVVAETRTAVQEMTVGAAVMQLDLAEAPVVVFKNAAHGGLNVVYRRADGHIGWVDPTA
jgi:ribosomal subunit interface protein